MPASEKNNGLGNSRLQMAESGSNSSVDIDLVEMFYRLLENAKWIILAAMLGAFAFGLYTHNFVTPTYQSTAKLYVVNSSDSAINLTDLNIGDKIADDFVQVFRNRDVYDQVVIHMKEKYGVDLKYSFGRMQSMMGISIITDTRILKITVTSPDPVEAYQIATAYADMAKEFIAGIMGMDKPTDFEKARIATSPSGPNMSRSVVMGFLVGAVIATAIIVLQFIVDDRIRTAEQLQKRLGMPTLGMVPIQGTERKNRKKSKGARK